MSSDVTEFRPERDSTADRHAFVILWQQRVRTVCPVTVPTVVAQMRRVATDLARGHCYTVFVESLSIFGDGF